MSSKKVVDVLSEVRFVIKIVYCQLVMVQLNLHDDDWVLSDAGVMPLLPAHSTP